MLLNRGELAGWGVAVLVIIGMGVLVFTGPFHHINKSSAPSSIVRVSIVTDPADVGAYKPSTTTVRIGQEVDFPNVSNVDHTATDKGNFFNSQNIPVGGTFRYRPSKAGTFHYYCVYHPRMLGVLVVKQ